MTTTYQTLNNSNYMSYVNHVEIEIIIRFCFRLETEAGASAAACYGGHYRQQRYWSLGGSGSYRDLTRSNSSDEKTVSSHWTDHELYTSAAKICREFLSTFLAGPVLDSLSESARQVGSRHVATRATIFSDQCFRLPNPPNLDTCSASLCFVETV